MPDPDIIRVGEQFRARLARLDQAAAKRMIEVYGRSFQRIELEIARLEGKVQAMLAAGEEVAKGTITRLWQQSRLERLILTEMRKFGVMAGPEIEAAQAAALEMAEAAAKRMIESALPPGITTRLLGQIGLGWTEIPTDALNSMIGTLGDGSPLKALLDEIGPMAAQSVEAELTDGLLRGVSPRVMARKIRNSMGMGLTRALTISRTETLRAFREGQRARWQANPNMVKGYRRLCAHNTRTCMGCIAVDGKFYPGEEPAPTHVNCRCTFIPETISYADLGLDVPEWNIEDDYENGRQWFEGLNADDQADMMGKGGYDAWQSGQVDLEDFVKTDTTRAWGKAERAASLRDMGL